MYKLNSQIENEKTDVVYSLQVVMAAAEVENLVHRFLTSLGRGTDWDAEEFDSIASVIPAFKFGILITVMESKYAKDVDEGGVREAITDVHDYFVLDVLKKVSRRSAKPNVECINAYLLWANHTLSTD